jgi:putative membrane protein
MKRKLKDYFKISIFGFSMGAANVIPGVSGGTMAFILGIYEELIDSIRAFASSQALKDLLGFKFKKLYDELPWRFLLALGIGVGIALLTLAKFLSFCLDKHRELTFALFFGLVLASIVTVLKQVKKWGITRYIAITAGALIAFLIVTLVPVETPHVWWNLFLCGIIIICAMILPGISGSFLLLVLGQYKYVLGAVNMLISVPIALVKNEKMPEPDVIYSALLTLFWIISGCIIGLGSFSHLLNWLFKKYHDITVATLIGFMIGSLWKLWPWQIITKVVVKLHKEVYELSLPLANPQLEVYKAAGAKITPVVTKNILPALNSTFYYAVLLAATGFAAVIIMEKFAAEKE